MFWLNGSVGMGVRSVAELVKTTNRPLALIPALKDGPLPLLPLVLTLTNVVLPSRRSRTKAFWKQFGSFGVRFGAALVKATNRPFALMAGSPLKLPAVREGKPGSRWDARIVWPALTSRTNTSKLQL